MKNKKKLPKKKTTQKEWQFCPNSAGIYVIKWERGRRHGERRQSGVIAGVGRVHNYREQRVSPGRTRPKWADKQENSVPLLFFFFGTIRLNTAQSVTHAALIQTRLRRDPGIQRVNESHLL